MLASSAGGPLAGALGATVGPPQAVSIVTSAVAPRRVRAVAGVLVHALAGDLWRERTGADRGLLAGEIAEAVPKLIARLARGGELLAV